MYDVTKRCHITGARCHKRDESIGSGIVTAANKSLERVVEFSQRATTYGSAFITTAFYHYVRCTQSFSAKAHKQRGSMTTFYESILSQGTLI